MDEQTTLALLDAKIELLKAAADLVKKAAQLPGNGGETKDITALLRTHQVATQKIEAIRCQLYQKPSPSP